MTVNIKSNQYFIRQFGITPFRRFLSDAKIKHIAKGIKHLRDRKITIISYLWLLVMVQLDNTVESLDELIKLKWLTLRKEFGYKNTSAPISKQALSKRNTQTPSKIFKEIYQELIKSSDKFIKTNLYKGLYLLEILDTTTIDLVSRLISKFPGGTNKSCKIMKAQMRLHTDFNYIKGIPQTVVITDGRANEKRKAKQLMRRRKKSVIFIFDLGYWSYEFLNEIHQRTNYFVSRLRADCRPKKIKRIGKGDWLVMIPQKGGSKKKNIYRLVSVKIDGKRRYYLTNLLDNKRFTKEEIACIYKWRWQIEIFFRDLKYVLKLTRFISYTPNGIKIQIYIGLITYILGKLVINESANKYKVSADKISFPKAIKAINAWMQHKISLLYNNKFNNEDYEELLLIILKYAYTESPPLKIDVKLLNQEIENNVA